MTINEYIHCINESIHTDSTLISKLLSVLLTATLQTGNRTFLEGTDTDHWRCLTTLFYSYWSRESDDASKFVILNSSFASNYYCLLDVLIIRFIPTINHHVIRMEEVVCALKNLHLGRKYCYSVVTILLWCLYCALLVFTMVRSDEKFYYLLTLLSPSSPSLPPFFLFVYLTLLSYPFKLPTPPLTLHTPLNYICTPCRWMESIRIVYQSWVRPRTRRSASDFCSGYLQRWRETDGGEQRGSLVSLWGMLVTFTLLKSIV